MRSPFTRRMFTHLLAASAVVACAAATAQTFPSKPVRFIGIGEGIDDLQAFRADEFVEALLGSP